MARKAKTETNGSAEHSESPGIGHNGDNELSEDQKLAQFFNYKKKWYSAHLTLKNLEEEIKGKIGKQGVRDIRIAIQLDTPEGEERLKEKLEAQMRVARWMGLPIGAQEDFFPDDRRPAIDVAREMGKRHGLAGDPYKPNYAPETEQYRYYTEGFNEGQAILAKGFKTLQPEVHTEEDLRPRFKQHDDA